MFKTLFKTAEKIYGGVYGYHQNAIACFLAEIHSLPLTFILPCIIACSQRLNELTWFHSFFSPVQTLHFASWSPAFRNDTFHPKKVRKYNVPKCLTLKERMYKLSQPTCSVLCWSSVHLLTFENKMLKDRMQYFASVLHNTKLQESFFKALMILYQFGFSKWATQICMHV